jgi:hypothetical protein
LSVSICSCRFLLDICFGRHRRPRGARLAAFLLPQEARAPRQSRCSGGGEGPKLGAMPALDLKYLARFLLFHQGACTAASILSSLAARGRAVSPTTNIFQTACWRSPSGTGFPQVGKASPGAKQRHGACADGLTRRYERTYASICRITARSGGRADSDGPPLQRGSVAVGQFGRSATQAYPRHQCACKTRATTTGADDAEGPQRIARPG